MVYLVEKIRDDRIFIIGEAGVNHNGNLEIAKQLIDIAVEAGCDAVKFQTFKAENLVSKYAQKAKYQIENTGNNESQYDMLKKLELSKVEYMELSRYSNLKGIIFMSTPFDENAADTLEELGVEIFKIPSGEITNIPFLKHVAKKEKPIILSTGMSTLGEVEEAVCTIKNESKELLILLHCVSNYPAKSEDVNLKAMNTMRLAFNVDVGYSDHTMGIEIPIAAAALGAKVIEKHFTIDRNMEGPDHKASLTPEELKEMVAGIRNVELAMGSGLKQPTENELDTMRIARKSIVSKEYIEKGTVITEEMVTIKRPGTGISPKHLNLVVGAVSKDDISSDQVIEWVNII